MKSALALDPGPQADFWRPWDAGSAELIVDGRSPSWICEPRSPEEVAAALGLAHREGAAVIPWGGGTRMSVGMPPRQYDVALCITGLDGVVEYEPADLTVTVQAGMRFGALQTLLGEHQQMLGLDPPAAAMATVGGVIASNASGPMRLGYGTARDLVIGVRVANADGTLTKAGGRVVKNVSGYDLNKLYTGSFGTLGVLVEISFKLHPLPRRFGSVAASFESAAAAQRAVQSMVRSPLGLTAIEMLDGATARALCDLTVPAQGVLVVVMASGFERAVERQCREALLLCSGADHTAELDEATAERVWSGVRELMDLQGRPEDCVVKISVPPARSAAIFQALQDACAAQGIAVRVAAHAGSGVVYGRCTGLSEGDGRAVESQVALLRGLRERAVEFGGSLVVERASFPVKTALDVWGAVGSSLRIMAAIKGQLDARNVLNPGRFVGHL